MNSVFLVIDYDESAFVLGAFTNRYRANKARKKRADWRKLRIVEVPLDRDLPEIEPDETRVHSSDSVAERLLRLLVENPARIVSRGGCTFEDITLEDGTLVEAIEVTADRVGLCFPCPAADCTATIEWYDDCTATWCDRCPWSGWGLELRYGLPGSLTGVL